MAGADVVRASFQAHHGRPVNTKPVSDLLLRKLRCESKVPNRCTKANHLRLSGLLAATGARHKSNPTASTKRI